MFYRIPSLLVGILLGCKVAFADSEHHSNKFDPKCPKGYYPGVVVTEGQYTVPFHKMYNLTGSFHHAEWYTVTNTTNHGEDNTVGATRSGDFEGVHFDEELVRVFKDEGEAMIAYVSQIPIKFPNPSGGKLTSYPSYIEELRLISICQGAATLVHFWATYCADDTVGSWDAWARVRGESLNRVIIGEGAQEFKGTCPGPLPK